MVTIIQYSLIVIGIVYLTVFFNDVRKHKDQVKSFGTTKSIITAIIGVITNFFDTLGIGSYAPQAILYKLVKIVEDDSYTPGTLNVANTIPVMCEALIFITIVEVDSLTLIAMVIAAVVGSLVAARLVSKLPVKKVQVVIGISLGITCVMMALRQLGLLDMLGHGNEANGLRGMSLALGIIGNFICGSLSSVGVGLYAPCMALVYFLGLNPLVAFPIMMTSCAALMPASSIEFIRLGKYTKITSIIIMLSGIPGVYFAAKVVKNLSLDILVWLVIVVVAYASISMLRDGFKKTVEEN